MLPEGSSTELGGFMHIAFAASECVPFSKTGGLADVVGSLPQELAKIGHTVTVYLPRYRLTKLDDPRQRDPQYHSSIR